MPINNTECQKERIWKIVNENVNNTYLHWNKSNHELMYYTLLLCDIIVLDIIWNYPTYLEELDAWTKYLQTFQ